MLLLPMVVVYVRMHRCMSMRNMVYADGKREYNAPASAL